MDLKIKTATLTYSRGPNTKHSNIAFGTFAKELLGAHAMVNYEPALRRVTVQKATSNDSGAKVIQVYRNQKFPWKISGPDDMPISGVIEVQARYDADRQAFIFDLPEQFPPAVARPRKPRKPPSPLGLNTTNLRAAGDQKSLRDQALKARQEFVTALGRLNGTLYAVDKATGAEVQIIPSTLKIRAKMTVMKVEDVEI